MRLGEMPEPELRDDDVLIEVHAAGVNQLDSKIKSGEFKLILPYRMPLVLGHDVAGVVTRVGSRVRQFKVGDEVYSRPRDHRIGTFAELIAVNEHDVAPKPKNVTMEEAASIPLVGLTVWQALVERANLKKGQKVFIQAGSGGVGTLAIQLAKHLGATVATTTSRANIDLVKSLGADVVIDYKKDDFETVLHELRRGSAQPGRGGAREVASRSQAWRNAHLDFRPSRSRIRKRNRSAVVRERHRSPAELRSQEKGAPS